MFSSQLQLEVLAHPLLLSACNNKTAIEVLHKNLECAEKVGAKKVLLRFTQSPFKQLNLSAENEISILDEIWPFLEPFQFEILVESFKSRVIQYALFKGARGFYDLNALNDASLISLALNQKCTVILPLECPFNLLEYTHSKSKQGFEIWISDTVSKIKSLYKMGIQKLLLDPFGLGIKKPKNHFKNTLNICRHIRSFQEQGLAIFAPIHQDFSDVQKSSFLTLALENKADCIQTPNLINLRDVLREY